MEPIEAVTEAPAPPIDATAFKPLASYWHTFLIVLLMCGVGVMSALSFQRGRAPTTPLALYIPTIIWLWSLALLVYAGVRRRGLRLRDVFGVTWRSFDDFLMDVSIAFGFWLVALLFLVALSMLLMKISGTPAPTTLPTELRALAPQGVVGVVAWMVLSVTAGICEEFVFRGYLQKQLISLTRNAIAGIILSAVVFSVGHLYEGAVKAVVIGVFGILLGMLAHLRRSLAPGMIAHAWHDIFSGLLLTFLSRAMK